MLDEIGVTVTVKSPTVCPTLSNPKFNEPEVLVISDFDKS